MATELDRYKLKTEIQEDYVIHVTEEELSPGGYGIITLQEKWVERGALGSGGCGVVTLQEKEGGGGGGGGGGGAQWRRAVKRLPRGMGSTDHTRELGSLIRLMDRQDLFVLFYGWYENRFFTFIAMEYIEHGDLSQYLQTPNARPNACEITRQLLTGLGILHKRQICHRDLKPQNVLIASLHPIRIKIADFGGSKYEKGTELRTRLGTQGYLAPEMLGLLSTGSRHTNAVDMWALGCIVHEILTLQTPFLEAVDPMVISGLKVEDTVAVTSRQTDFGSLSSFCLGKIAFPVDILQQCGVSERGIDFVKMLLRPNPETRVSAVEALQSPWLLELGRGYAHESGGLGASVGEIKKPAMVLAEPPKQASRNYLLEDSHRRKAPSHQMLPPSHQEFIRSVFESGGEQQGLELDSTKWFGIVESKQVTFFEDYGRYARLASSTGRDPASQYPCLISFVGEMGSGKSTLIKLLITLGKRNSVPETPLTPVVGEPNSTTPTSGGVHLFGDPTSFATARPLLFADCEGPKGGNRIPKAPKNSVRSYIDRLIYHGKVSWMKHTSEESQRRWIVEGFYPKVLFTFSDVICFVTKNSQVLDEIFTQVVVWAHSAFGKSINQPVLPHAIIVINSCDEELESTDEGSTIWDVEYQTETLLKMHSSFIRREKRLERIVPALREDEKDTLDLKGLLEFYFSSVKIIYIPDRKKVPGNLKPQSMKLYDLIHTASEEARQKREKSLFLLNSEDLDMHFKYAWKHFSKEKEKAFNFLESTILYRPVPTNMRHHICMLAVHVQKYYLASDNSLDPRTGMYIFTQLAELLASYIFLDVIRTRFPIRDASVFEGYRGICEDAIADFFHSYQLCEMRDKFGKRCRNIAAGHQKGHQIVEGGDVFGKNGSPFFVDSPPKSFLPGLTKRINDRLQGLFKDLKDSSPGSTGEKRATEIHKMVLKKPQYSAFWNLPDFPKNHETCFGCVSAAPIHALFCGHTICKSCVKGFSEPSLSDELGEIKVKVCPLCVSEVQFTEAWTQKIRPPEAGLRVLSLDGGGIRSIIQLEILERLEKAIGLNVPIHTFFDLIVGTGGGGIVALGLGAEGCSVAKCKKKFKALAANSLELQTSQFKMVRYQTKNLETALKATFREDLIFGGKRGNCMGTRVAVTTTKSTNTGEQPYLIANYKHEIGDSADAKPHLRERGSEGQERTTPYSFYRAENDKREFKMWEAARATTADPGLFDPFVRDPKKEGEIFLGGGLRVNNPIVAASCEMVRLWPGESSHHPDLILSIGAGESETTKDEPRPPDFKKSFRRLGEGRGKGKGKDEMELPSDYNHAWENFTTRLGGASDNEHKESYCRLNVNFREVLPEVDAVKSMDECQARAGRYCADKLNWEFSQVRAKLIASLFFFRPRDILCRLKAGSPELMALCQILHSQQYGPPGSPHLPQPIFFVTHEPKTSVERMEQQITVQNKIFEDVMGGKPFKLFLDFVVPHEPQPTRIYVKLGGDEREVVLISGSPRLVIQDYRDRRHKTRASRRFSDLVQLRNQSGVQGLQS